MKQHNLYHCLTRMGSAMPPEFETFKRLLLSTAYFLKSNEGPAQQRKMQEIESLIMAIKFSPMIPDLDTASSPALDLWDLLTPTSRPARFDEGMYQAALTYYGLDHNYRRVFAKTPKGLECVTPQQSAETNRACWVQVNEPEYGHAYTKASNAHIQTVSNITLDFEYPAEPARVHAIAMEFAYWLGCIGLTPENLPVEDSGAGAHICLPITPIAVKEFGGGELVNQAIAEIVTSHFKPEFNKIAARYGLAGKIKLEAFDISRIFSLPGTWRPGNSKPDEIYYLKNGYQRRWLPPYETVYPVRTESPELSIFIQAKCVELLNRKDEPKPAPKPVASGANVTEWLEGYVKRNPPNVTRRGSNDFDRSVYFHRLTWATATKFGHAVASDYASEINRLAGNKYRDANKEVERSLRSA